MKASTILRKENCGILVYSMKELCYFYPKNEKCNLQLQIVFDNICNNRPWDTDLSRDYREEFQKIGINNEARCVNNSNLIERALFAPLEYYLDYTNVCNLRCPHCYNKEHLGSITMEDETVRGIIQEMYELGISRVHLAGGEPTINKKGLFNYIKAVSEYGIVMSMATNGTLIDGDYASELMKSGLFAISVSIDGWDEETNSLIRGKGLFDAALKGTKYLVDAKKKMGASTEVCIKPIYTYKTPDVFFANMVELAISVGVDKIKFANPERSLHHEQKHYGTHKDRFFEQIQHIERLKEEYGNSIKITNANNPLIGCPPIGIPDMRGCIGAQELLTINPDGRITPCLMNDLELGNYYEYGSMKEFLLKSDRLAQYLKRIDNEQCHSCKSYRNCRGGCQVRKIVEYGDTISHDPLCPERYGKVQKFAGKCKNLQYLDEVIVSHSL